MKKQILTLTLTFIVCLLHAQVQVGSVTSKEYANFKSRTLIVVTEEQLPELAGKLDAEQLTNYQQEINDYNTHIKWAIETFYKGLNPVEFKTRSEVKEIIKQKNKSYAYLDYSKFRENYKTKVGFELTQKNRFAKEETRLSGALSVNFIISRIEIRFPESEIDAPSLIGQFMPDPFPEQADIAYAIKQIVATLNYRDKEISFGQTEKLLKDEAKTIQSKTLLVSESDIDNADDREKFLNAYKYPVQVVSKQKYNEAIINSDPQYACVITVPVLDQEDKVAFQFHLYDCASGNIYSKSRPQEKGGIGVETKTISALKSLKKATTESQIPSLRKENLSDFSLAIR